MKRKLSQKETNFLKELEDLLSRNEATVAVLGGRVSFFIDNKEEGDCIPTESYVDAASLSRLIRKGKVRLDWKQPEQYSARAKASEDYRNELRSISARSGRRLEGSTISVDDRTLSRSQVDDEPYKVTLAEFVQLIRQRGVQKVINDTQRGRYEIVVKKPICVSFTNEDMTGIMADICQIKDMNLRDSLITKLIS